ncbi:MAG: lytic murein transglycosylase [Patescibacteria group bacterium]|nr:lytic murein transglycosylase [Patescibacteria group bacterium]
MKTAPDPRFEIAPARAASHFGPGTGHSEGADDIRRIREPGNPQIRIRPRVLGDVIPRSGRGRSWNAYGTIGRLNLKAKRTIRIPFTRAGRMFFIFAAAVFFVFGSASAPTIFSDAAITRASGDTSNSTVAMASAATSSLSAADERTQLEAQLQQLEGQINQYEGQIASYKSQGNTLNGQIKILNDKIAKVNLQIKATSLTLQQLDQNISDTQSQISITQVDIQTKKTSLGNLLQGLYESDQVSLMEMFLKNPRLSDFWNDAQDLALAEANMRAAVRQVQDLQGELQDQVQQFEASRADAASIQEYQRAQASEISGTKTQKAQLLAETKGQESKYQALLKQTQATAAQIRNRIFQLLGGGQLSFEDAYQYAKLASNSTGVDASLILAVLDRESALGQNVGQCTYKTSMSPSNIPVFLEITQQLHLDPNTMMVSCANADGAYGGAMGPAQFLPSTWELYADGITGITGDNPPSPWNNADAFAATGLYLKDAMAGCKAAYSNATSIMRCTAAKYYAGSRWRNYLWTYGEAVVERAQSFAEDIQTITS